MPEPFTPQTAPEVLADLRARLRATRWPDAPEDAGWSMGTDLEYLRELVAYWADGFDWPAQEAALNRLPRFRAPVGGLGIHFVHARAAGPALPLVLGHGRTLRLPGGTTTVIAAALQSPDAQPPADGFPARERS